MAGAPWVDLEAVTIHLAPKAAPSEALPHDVEVARVLGVEVPGHRASDEVRQLYADALGRRHEGQRVDDSVVPEEVRALPRESPELGVICPLLVADDETSCAV